MTETSTLVTPFTRWAGGIPGVYVARLNAGRRGGVRMAEKGTPDVLWVVDGRAYWTEFKRPGERPTDTQTRMHGRLRAAGCVVYVRDDLELAKEDVRMALQDHGGRR